MQVDAGRRLQSPIRIVAAGADVVRKLRGVVAEAQPVVGLVVVAVTGNELGLAIALEAGVRSDVEDAVGAVAIFGRIAAGLGLQVRDVFGIELRPDVGGDVGVGDRHAVDGPRDLVAAANVQLVVHHVRAGNKLGDDLEAVAGVHTGVAGDLLLADENVAARRIGIQVFRGGGDRDFLLRAGEGKLVVEHRRRSGNHDQHLRLRREPRGINVNGVLAERHGVEVKLAVVVGLGGHFEGGIVGLQGGVRAADRVVLRIVHHAAYVAEDGGADRECPLPGSGAIKQIAASAENTGS